MHTVVLRVMLMLLVEMMTVRRCPIDACSGVRSRRWHGTHHLARLATGLHPLLRVLIRVLDGARTLHVQSATHRTHARRVRWSAQNRPLLARLNLCAGRQALSWTSHVPVFANHAQGARHARRRALTGVTGRREVELLAPSDG